MCGNLSGIDFKTTPKSVNTFLPVNRDNNVVYSLECANFVIQNVQIATHFTGMKTLCLKRPKIPFYTPKRT